MSVPCPVVANRLGEHTGTPRIRHAATKHAAGPTGVYTREQRTDTIIPLEVSLVPISGRLQGLCVVYLLHPNKKHGNDLQRLKKKKESRVLFGFVSAVNERFIVIRERVLTLSPQLAKGHECHVV